MGVDVSHLVSLIQYVLSPAIMVSSSALLLLGFNNKFSNLASRFRVLNQEKRVLMEKIPRTLSEESRLTNLEAQVSRLIRRASLVKRSIICCYGGIVCFTCTSVMIFFNAFNVFGVLNLGPVFITIFLLGLLLILSSAVMLIVETKLFYQVILLESES
ncbi:MAG: DUF2721 domain-containing protein [Oligoflexia bacterium]|nr:DUF2721 domain-containing protein [Oligoflexia bacterium]